MKRQTLEKKQREWHDALPPKVKKVALKRPFTTCYFAFNDNGLRGHYLIHSYEEYKDGHIGLKVIHLNDSFLPGFAVFDFDQNGLKKCGCLMRNRP